jgi:hypothetical protein
LRLAALRLSQLRFLDWVTVIFIDHLPRFTPLFMALPEGGQTRLVFSAFFNGRSDPD